MMRYHESGISLILRDVCTPVQCTKKVECHVTRFDQLPCLKYYSYFITVSISSSCLQDCLLFDLLSMFWVCGVPVRLFAASQYIQISWSISAKNPLFYFFRYNFLCRITANDALQILVLWCWEKWCYRWMHAVARRWARKSTNARLPLWRHIYIHCSRRYANTTSYSNESTFDDVMQMIPKSLIFNPNRSYPLCVGKGLCRVCMHACKISVSNSIIE